MDAILERYFSIVTCDMLTILEQYLTLQAVYSPQPSTFDAADLRKILQIMPELQTLELYFMTFEPEAVGTPHKICAATRVPFGARL